LTLRDSERVRAYTFFERAENTTTRGHSLKLKIPLAKSRLRAQVFSTRVANNWNSLPEKVVSSKTVNEFKNQLDKHWSHLKYEHA